MFPCAFPLVVVPIHLLSENEKTTPTHFFFFSFIASLRLYFCLNKDSIILFSEKEKVKIVYIYCIWARDSF